MVVAAAFPDRKSDYNGLGILCRTHPIAIIMREVGRDPLKLRFDPEKPSYGLDRMSVGERQTSMTDQF